MGYSQGTSSLGWLLCDLQEKKKNVILYLKHGKNIVYLILKMRYIVRNLVLFIMSTSISNVYGNNLDVILKLLYDFCPKKYYQPN